MAEGVADRITGINQTPWSELTDQQKYEMDRGYSVASDEDILSREETVAGPQEHPAQALGRMTAALRNTKKLAGVGNSEKFQSLDDSLREVLDLLSHQLPKNDVRESNSILMQVGVAYGRLITACEGYVSFRLHLTSAGRARQRIAKEILHRARTDQRGLAAYMDSSVSMEEDQRAGTVSEALGMARRRTLVLNGKTEGELKHVGGVSSFIAVLERGDLTDVSASGFFKEEDIFTYRRAKENALMALDTVQKRSPIAQADYQSIRQAILDEPEIGQTPDYTEHFAVAAKRTEKYWKDRVFHEYVNAVIKTAAAISQVGAKIDSSELGMYLKMGESVNMSRRNVASSRIAQLFGVGDLIAQSETATLKDENGTLKMGNLMQKARGTEAMKAAHELQRDNFRRMRKEYNYNVNKPLKENMPLIADDYLTPEFLKSLTSLQVLDNLMGQADRHAGNFMIDQNDQKRLGRVQGIDNDFAFGYTTEIGAGGYNRSIFNRGTSLSETDPGELTLPYMDAALADRIVAVRPEEVRLVLADLIEEPAIEAFLVRLDMIQKGILRDRRENPDSGRYLKTTEDWAQTLEFFKQDAKTKDYSTYVGQFLFLASEQNATYGALAGHLMEEERMEMASQAMGEELSQPEYDGLDDAQHAEKLRQFLEGFGVEKKILDYLQNTGRLNRDVDVKGILSEFSLEILKKIHRQYVKRYQKPA
ncbi:MAG: hypothetical protein IJC59_03595 [Lachnospiraceae bacterium]|nr:hypothetical protein [Lachnospiraceae bacterium]